LGRPGFGVDLFIAHVSKSPRAGRAIGVARGWVDLFGFEHPDVNTCLLAAGTPYFPDLRWPAERLILEVDSGWHDGRVAQQLDAERQADLEAAGERVLRTTAEQAILAPRQLARRLSAAGAPYADAKPRPELPL